jgi:hypothetical protein
MTAPVVVEQDSLEDVINCVSAALRTDKGSRVDMPTFGVPDPTFQVLPMDTNEIIAEVTSHEDRAAITLAETPDKLDSLIDQITAEVGLREERRV